MQACDVVQFSEEEVDANGSLSYALLSWSALSQEQKDAETPLAGDGIEQWKRGLTHTGALGVYRSGLEEQLNALTGCDQHQKLRGRCVQLLSQLKLQGRCGAGGRT